MSDIILAFLTSEGCGHCHASRGDGELGNGKQFTSYQFLRTHIEPTGQKKQATLLNIHFGSMTGLHSQILQISKIYLKNNSIYQEKYYSMDGVEVMVKISSINSKNKITVIGQKQASVGYKWGEFLKKKIPTNIQNYTYFFPCFIVFKSSDWKKSGNILGITNAGFTIRDETGVYKIEKVGRTLSDRNVPPQKLVSEALSGVLKFEPHKDDFKKKEETKKRETPAKKEEKTEPLSKKEKPKLSKCRFIVKNYDDEE